MESTCVLQDAGGGGKKKKKHTLANEVHQIDSSLLIGSAVHIASSATACYHSLRAIYILQHFEILCWKRKESVTAKPGFTSQLLSGFVSIREI